MNDAFLENFLIFAELVNEPSHEHRVRWSKFRKWKVSWIRLDADFAAEFSKKWGNPELLDKLKTEYAIKRSRSRIDMLAILHDIVLKGKGDADLEEFLSVTRYQGEVSEYSIPEAIFTEYQKEIVFDIAFDIKKEYRRFLNEITSIRHEWLAKLYLRIVPYLNDGPAAFGITNFFAIPVSRSHVSRIFTNAAPATLTVLMGIGWFNMAYAGNNFLESVVWAYLGLVFSGILFEAKAYGWKETAKNLGFLILIGIIVDRFSSSGGIYGIVTLLLFISPFLSIWFGLWAKFLGKVDGFETYSSVLYLSSLAVGIATAAWNRGLLRQFDGSAVKWILLVALLLFINYKIVEFFRPKSQWTESRAKNSQIRADFWEHRKNWWTLSEKEFTKLIKDNS